MAPEAFAQYGIAGIALGVVVYLARLFTAHVQKKDEHFIHFLGNHMSGNTKVLQDLVVAVETLKEEVRAGRG